MSVYRLYPRRYWHPIEPPKIDKRKCKAFRCKNRRSMAWPLKKVDWCTDHCKDILFYGKPPPPRTVWQYWRRRKERR